MKVYKVGHNRPEVKLLCFLSIDTTLVSPVGHRAEEMVEHELQIDVQCKKMFAHSTTLNILCSQFVLQSLFNVLLSKAKRL